MSRTIRLIVSQEQHINDSIEVDHSRDEKDRKLVRCKRAIHNTLGNSELFVLLLRIFDKANETGLSGNSAHDFVKSKAFPGENMLKLALNLKPQPHMKLPLKVPSVSSMTYSIKKT